MNYEALFAGTAQQEVKAALIGVGEFGRTLIAQSQLIPGFSIPVLCDQSPSRALENLVQLGIAAEQIAVCSSRAAAEEAMRKGQYALVQSAAIAADLPVDIVVEATGNAFAAAENAVLAIDAGRHIAMVTKEAESVIGPALQQRARAAGVVHCLIDGDQPSLLIGLVSWARTLGLEIVAAGKSSEYDFVYESEDQSVEWNGRRFEVGDLEDLWDPEGSNFPDLAAARAERLSAIPQRTVPDLCEMALVCNETGLIPDRPELHLPLLRSLEVPSAITVAEQGGLLSRTGVVEVFNCLRRPQEPSFAGGVFVNVACHDRQTWDVLARKGIPVSRNGDCAMLYNPQHLLGVEAPISILLAARLGLSSGGMSARPVVDLVARASRHFAAGETLTITDPHAHAVEGLEPLLLPAGPLSAAAPLPYYLAAGRRLRRDVEEGALITTEAVEVNEGSKLWQLRCEQDRNCFGQTTRET